MKRLLIFAAALVIVGVATSHEYIFIAHNYRLQKGDTLEMHLFVADGFNIELERPMQPNITKRFELISENGVADLKASTPGGTLPVINRAVDFEGGGLVHATRDYAYISLPANEFLAYLKEDHIENITLPEKKKNGVQRERYTRYLKALVQSGPVKNDTLYKLQAGHQFEILLLQNPYKLKRGALLQAKLLFRGKPLAHKTITARNRKGNNPALAVSSRTDQNGVANFKLSREGDWFLHATHMIPCEDLTVADWESFWVSYSFGLE